jgi:hypothetical protein
MPAKVKVVIIGSFGVSGVEVKGGRDRLEEEKKSMLHISRIKYLIEKKLSNSLNEEVGRNSYGLRNTYEANPFYISTGRISEDALLEVRDADILVALLTRANQNVIFELATRAAFQRCYVLISDIELPVYLMDVARIRYKHDDDKSVLKEIDNIAKNPNFTINWIDVKRGKMPKVLQARIDEFGDSRLCAELANAFYDIESNEIIRPNFLRRMFSDLDPEQFLNSWEPTIPISVLKIKWKGKSGQEYAKRDMDGDITICYANNSYYQLFDHTDVGAELTSHSLFSKLERYMSAENYESFAKDQDRTTREAVFQSRYSSAAVPISLSNEHPIYPGKVFLPVIIGRKSLTYNKDYSKPHIMYIIVALIEGFSSS